MSTIPSTPNSSSDPTKREMLNFEKLKFRVGIVKWFLVSIAIVIAGILIESGFKERAAGVQEMQAFDKYIDPVLQADNFEARWRLSEFFSIVTPTDRLRKRWELYRDYLKPQRDSVLRLRGEKDSIQRSGIRSKKAIERWDQINNQLEQFDRKLLDNPRVEKTSFKSENEVDQKLKQKADAIREKIAVGTYFNLTDYFNKVGKAYTQAVQDVVKSIGEGFGDTDPRFNLDYNFSTYSCRYGISSKLNTSKAIIPFFSANFSQDSVSLSIGLDDEKKEELNLKIQGLDWNKVYSFIKKFFVDRLNRLE